MSIKYNHRKGEEGRTEEKEESRGNLNIPNLHDRGKSLHFLYVELKKKSAKQIHQNVSGGYFSEVRVWWLSYLSYSFL